jgi:hypothetical protein
VDAGGPVGAVLDDAARAAYRDRIATLRAELAQARDRHDPERAAWAESEVDFLTHVPAAATRLGDRARGVTGPAERAGVSHALRTAIQAIAATDETAAHVAGGKDQSDNLAASKLSRR